MGELVKALKTRKQVIKGEELFLLEDWEVVKKDLSPSKEYIVTLTGSIVIISSLIAYFIQSDNQSDNLIVEFSNLVKSFLEFVQPFVWYLVGTTVAKSILHSKENSEKEISIIRNAYFYYYGQYCIVFLIWFYFSNMLIDIGKVRFDCWKHLSIGQIVLDIRHYPCSHVSQGLFSYIGYFGVLLKIFVSFKLAYLTFWVIPDKLNLIAKIDKFSRAKYAMRYLLSSIWHTIRILFFIVISVGIVLGIKYVFDKGF